MEISQNQGLLNRCILEIMNETEIFVFFQGGKVNLELSSDFHKLEILTVLKYFYSCQW